MHIYVACLYSKAAGDTRLVLPEFFQRAQTMLRDLVLGVQCASDTETIGSVINARYVALYVEYPREGSLTVSTVAI
jgi:hypothetical protein